MKDQLINAFKGQIKNFKEGDHVFLEGETDLQNCKRKPHNI